MLRSRGLDFERFGLWGSTRLVVFDDAGQHSPRLSVEAGRYVPQVVGDLGVQDEAPYETVGPLFPVAITSPEGRGETGRVLRNSPLSRLCKPVAVEVCPSSCFCASVTIAASVADIAEIVSGVSTMFAAVRASVASTTSPHTAIAA